MITVTIYTCQLTKTNNHYYFGINKYTKTQYLLVSAFKIDAFLTFMTVKSISSGFMLLVRQIETFEDVNMGIFFCCFVIKPTVCEHAL